MPATMGAHGTSLTVEIWRPIDQFALTEAGPNFLAKPLALGDTAPVVQAGVLHEIQQPAQSTPEMIFVGDAERQDAPVLALEQAVGGTSPTSIIRPLLRAGPRTGVIQETRKSAAATSIYVPFPVFSRAKSAVATFFTNLVLMASFLGMSVGCLAASRKANYINAVLPLALVSVGLSVGSLVVFTKLASHVGVDVGRQGSPQEIFFGTEPRAAPLADQRPDRADRGRLLHTDRLDVRRARPGDGPQVQCLARSRLGLYDEHPRQPGRDRGFRTGLRFENHALALVHRQPDALRLYLPKLSLLQVASLAGSLLVVGDASSLGGEWSKVIWSPYYKVEYDATTGDLVTNNIGHQRMQKSPEIGTGYALPHLLNRDAGGKPFDDVLIIGAGSGNDVQAALGHGVKHVDAVEIEPVLE